LSIHASSAADLFYTLLPYTTLFRSFYTMFGVSRDETQGVPLYGLGNGALELARLRKQLTKTLAGSHAFRSVEVDHVVTAKGQRRSEEHTSELQSRVDLVCRLLLDRK